MSTNYQCADCGSHNVDRSESCLVRNCGEAPFSRGWCPKHYNRWWRHGDPRVVLRRGPSPKPMPERGHSGQPQRSGGRL